MPTEEQKVLVDTIDRYMIFAGVGLGCIAFIVQATTNDKMLSGRIITTGLWLVFAVSNFTTFYTGCFRWKHGPTLTRESSPMSFYTSALFFCFVTMSIATILLWKAYTS